MYEASQCIYFSMGNGKRQENRQFFPWHFFHQPEYPYEGGDCMVHKGKSCAEGKTLRTVSVRRVFLPVRKGRDAVRNLLRAHVTTA